MNTKPRIFVSRAIPAEGLDLLSEKFQVTVAPQDAVISRAALEAGIKNCDGLLCTLTDPIDAALLDLNPGLKIVATYAVGYNNIDIVAATARKIPVTNTPGVLTEATADLCFALLMDVARRVTEGDRLTRAGGFKGWGPLFMLGTEVTGKTLGIVGMGRIGQALAKRARGFDMPVLYTKRQRMSAAEEKDLNATHVDLEHLLKNADFVSLHCPLTPETKHLIGKDQLASMKKTAFLINTARGPIVDEKALVKALEQKVIAGAALDVFEDEPVLAPGLAALPSVVLAPHLGSATLETRTKMALIAASNIIARFNGQNPPNLINPEALN